MHLTVLWLSRKLVTMTRKFIPENYIFKRKDAKTQRLILNTENTKETKRKETDVYDLSEADAVRT